MNQGKANDLAPLFDAYRAVLPAVIATMRTDLLRGNPVSSWPTVKPADFASPLSGRHFKSVWNMAYAAFDAWRATLKDTVRATITGSSLDEDTRTVLYRVNRAGAWHVPGLHLDWQVTDTGELVVPPPKNKRKEFEAATIVSLPVDPQTMFLARHIVAHARTRHPFPNLSRVHTIKLDSPVAPIHHRPGSLFPWWVRVSTLHAGKPVWVPLTRNPRLDTWLGQPGAVLAGNVQLHQGTDGQIGVSLVVKAPNVTERDGEHYLGLDWGACVLFATSDGRLYGRRMLTRLRELDAVLTAHTADLNRRHIKWKTDRYYRVLHAKITGYVTNEVGRVLNLIANDTTVTGLVVEKLDFRHGGLSKTMNRIISIAGRATVKKKLDRLTETHGITHTGVQSAYTSQQCSHCHYTHKSNRRTRDRFRCKCCGLSLHADINGARCIQARRSDQEINTSNGAYKSGRDAILRTLTTRHTQTCHRDHTQRTRPLTGRRDGQDQHNPALATTASPKIP